MKISTKGRYGLEIAVDLARCSSYEKVESIRNIAERRNLSIKYLERIIGRLKKAGLVKSTRGAKGGYCLSKDPKEITVKEILAAAEGDMAPVKCLRTKLDCGIESERCVTKKFWKQIWLQANDVFESISLYELLEKSKEYEK